MIKYRGGTLSKRAVGIRINVLYTLIEYNNFI